MAAEVRLALVRAEDAVVVPLPPPLVLPAPPPPLLPLLEPRRAPVALLLLPPGSALAEPDARPLRVPVIPSPVVAVDVVVVVVVVPVAVAVAVLLLARRLPALVTRLPDAEPVMHKR